MSEVKCPNCRQSRYVEKYNSDYMSKHSYFCHACKVQFDKNSKVGLAVKIAGAAATVFGAAHGVHHHQDDWFN